MTRDEAIKILVNEKWYMSRYSDEYSEAYDMAIQALEECMKSVELLPPVTPTEQREHGRLIDADKLLQELFIVDEEEWTTPEIRTILENAPPVEPDRPQGEWRGEHKMPDMPRYEWYRCSECSFLSQSVVNYCPNCGAKMGGDTE